MREMGVVSQSDVTSSKEGKAVSVDGNRARKSATEWKFQRGANSYPSDDDGVL